MLGIKAKCLRTANLTNAGQSHVKYGSGQQNSRFYSHFLIFY